ncbi:MAG: FUSC family protein [Rhizobacter sp.]|nr:FUSC family protein [Rhizobacter sp.]
MPSLPDLLRHELRELTRVNQSDRLWQMALAASLAMGLPLLAGVYFGHLNLGLVGSLAGLVFLYITHTPLHHRMVALMACAFGMNACYALGVLCHPFTGLLLPVITVVSMLVMMVSRYYALAPPGGLFFIMALAIGAYTPVGWAQVPVMVGVFTLGTLLACVIAFLYSLLSLRLRAPVPVQPLPPPSFDFVVFDPVVIGVFVGLSLAVAQLLQLERPYWVPVSCVAVIQGASLRAVWNKQLQRVLGTAAGLVVAWGVLSLPLGPWGLALTMMGLSFVVEVLVVRHYALAVTLITPLTMLLAEAANLGHAQPALLMQARFIDTVLGCAMGLLGGVCLHSAAFRAAVGRPLRALVPARLSRPPVLPPPSPP